MFGTKNSLLGKDPQGLGIMPRSILTAMERMNSLDNYETFMTVTLVELYMCTPLDLFNKLSKK